jgi:hypothetical protein
VADIQHRARRLCYSVGIALLAQVQLALAQSEDGAMSGGAPPNNSIGYGLPYGECGVWYSSSTRNLDGKNNVASGTCTLSLRPRLSSEMIVGLNLRAGWHDQLSADTNNNRFREAFLDWDNGITALRIGRQIISWGRADSLNPTDKLDPKNLTLLVSDDDGQRQGIDALNLRHSLDINWAITAVVAQFSPNVMPSGSLPNNIVPANSPGRAEWALKLDHSGQGIDGSLSYFDGFERAERYSVDLSNPATPLFRGDYEHAQSVGADFAFSTSGFTWRGEFSHTTLQPECLACDTSRRRVSRAVMGGDVELLSGVNFNLQYFFTQNHDFVDPASVLDALRPLQAASNLLNREFAGVERGVTMRLSDRLLNDKLKWEISAVADTTGNSWLIRPRVSYAFGDRLKLTVGLDLFEGDTQSYLGSLAQNRLAFALLSLVF